MNRIELIEKMYQIMDEKLVAYRKDFLYDIDALYTVNKNVWYWFLRDTGTNITFNKDLINSFKEINDIAYIIEYTIDGWSIKKFWEK